MLMILARFSPSGSKFRANSCKVTGVCSIEDFVAGKDLYRAAPFGLIPTPFPFSSASCTLKGADVAKAVEPKYMQILQTYSIKYSSILFRSVWRKCFRSEAVDTLIVETLDVDNRRWKEAASQILGVFYAGGLQPGEIKVEISNPVKMYHDVSICLPADEQLLGAIREGESPVLAIVRKELPGIWTSIAYHMRGPREDASQRKPTVMVTCKPDSQHFFEKIESSIAAVLHSEKYPQVTLHMELIPGSVELVAPPSPDRDSKPRALLKLKDKPVNGASIGVQNRQIGAGTLGGWVTLKSIGNSNQTLQCALTCYHVISEGDPANRVHNDRNGIGLKDEKPLSQIRIVWPSNFDANETRAHVQNRIQAPGSTPESRQRDKNYIEFLDKLSAADPIGHVRFASGHRRTTDNRRLDWALIVSSSTFTRNKPPSSTLFDNDDAWDKHPTYETGEDDFITGFGTMKGGDLVFKVGRTSSSSGEVNKIHRRVNWEDQEDSYEADVIGFGRDFALGGDSGAMVVNDKKELVGLLIGAQLQSSNWGFGFVTPIHAIIDDIRTMVNGDISLP